MHDETMASGVYLPEMDAAPSRYDRGTRHLEFRGNANDYFRIWIVNVALSLVTLGIYSAWATVRTRRYMYSSTRLADTPFEYLARPLPILKGRLLTALIFALYAFAGHISKPLQLGAALLVGAFMPWMIVKSLMFRARYSSWRGLRFYFTSDYGGAYQWYLLVYLLMGIPMILVAVLTVGGHPVMGLLLALAAVIGIYPWIKGGQQQWMAEHHHFGGKSFRFKADIDNYYKTYLKAAAVSLAWFIPTATLFGLVIYSMVKGHAQFDPKAPPAAVYCRRLCLHGSNVSGGLDLYARAYDQSALQPVAAGPVQLQFDAGVLAHAWHLPHQRTGHRLLHRPGGAVGAHSPGTLSRGPPGHRGRRRPQRFCP